MSKLWLYRDLASGQTALSVVKNAADNPHDIPATDFGKFLFDSRNVNQAAFADFHIVDLAPLRAGLSRPGTRNWPIGSSDAERLGYYERLNAPDFPDREERFIFIDRNPSSGKPAAMVRVYAIDNDGWFTAQSSFFEIRGTIFEPQYGQLDSWHGVPQIQFGESGDRPIDSDSLFDDEETSPWNGQAYWKLHGSVNRLAVAIWNIPGEGDPITFSPGPSTPGTPAVRMSNDGVRVAKSGHDALTADPDDMVVTPERTSAFIVTSGEVVVPAGATVTVSVPDDIDYAENVLLDFMGGETGSGQMFMPVNQVDVAQLIDGGYIDDVRARFVNGQMQVNNRGPKSITLLYLVYSKDSSAPDGGFGQLVRSVEGTENYTQFLRNNHTLPPRAGDILFDTRFRYLPIVAAGLLEFTPPGGNASSAQAPVTYDVDFTNDGGWRPFVLFRFRYGSSTKAWSAPRAQRLFASGSNFSGAFSCFSCRAEVTDTRVRFQTFPRHPSQMFWDFDPSPWPGSWNLRVIHAGQPSRVSAIAYVVLAVPVI